MIRLDSSKREKENILETIARAIEDPELELECLLINPISPTKSSITHDNFIAIIKRYKSSPEFDSSDNTRLTISLPNNQKHKNVRILIKGSASINSYCNNENIKLIRNSVDFEDKSKVSSLLISNYDIKFNLKHEQNFNNDEPRINDLLRELSNEKKHYRYKKTFSFEKKTKDFRIDVSIVKSSSSNSDNMRYITVKEVHDNKLYSSVKKPDNVKTQFSIWWKTIQSNLNEKVQVDAEESNYKNIKDSAVFTNKPSYEVEVEYVKNKYINKPKFKTLIEQKDYKIRLRRFEYITIDI